MNEPIPAGAVVVGIDGSDHSHRALDAASAVAAREHRPLHLLHCYEPYPAAMGPVLPSPDVTTTLRSIAEAVVQHGRERVASTNPSAGGHHEPQHPRRPGEALGGLPPRLAGGGGLARAGRHAQPAHGLGERLGGQPQRLPGAGGPARARARGPRARRRDGRRRRAGRPAGPRRGRRAPTRRPARRRPSSTPSCRPRCGGSLSRWCTASRRCPTTRSTCPSTRSATTSRCTGSSCRSRWPGCGRSSPTSQVELTLARGPAAAHLVEESRRARLLVLGAHHRSVWDLFLGSVNRSVVEHALCPVAVVPGRPAPDRSGPALRPAGTHHETVVPVPRLGRRPRRSSTRPARSARSARLARPLRRSRCSGSAPRPTPSSVTVTERPASSAATVSVTRVAGRAGRRWTATRAPPPGRRPSARRR